MDSTTFASRSGTEKLGANGGILLDDRTYMAALNVTDVSLAAFRSIDAAANGGPDRFFAAFIAARSGLRATMVRETIRACRIASGLHCFPGGTSTGYPRSWCSPPTAPAELRVVQRVHVATDHGAHHAQRLERLGEACIGSPAPLRRGRCSCYTAPPGALCALALAWHTYMG